MYKFRLLLIIFILFITIFCIYFVYKLNNKEEKYQIEQITGHFGGTPNKSQIWPDCGMVALGPDYDDPKIRYYNRMYKLNSY